MGSGSHTHQQQQLEVEVELEATTVEQQPPQPRLHDGHHQHNHGADGAATSESPRDCAFEFQGGGVVLGLHKEYSGSSFSDASTCEEIMMPTTRRVHFHRKKLRPRRQSNNRSPRLSIDSDDLGPVEVSVPALNESAHGPDSHGGHHAPKSRRIRISPNGQCTPMNENGEASEGIRDLPRTNKLDTEPVRTRSGRLKLGYFKHSLEDIITDAFLWLMRQSKGKHIRASKDVLKMYHDLFLYGEVPLTIKVRTALRGWPLRTYLIWIEFFAAIISVILYVLSTYEFGPTQHWKRLVELVCGLFFVIDYIFNVYSAPVRLYYIFSTTGLIDFISTLPIVLYWSPQKESGAAILLFLRVLRIMPVITQVGGLTGGAIKEQIFILVMYTFGVVFIAAGILQWVDNKATPQSVREAKGCDSHGCLTFFDALWFMIVTISTVGYGDITPSSDWGRLVVLCVIIGALVILPPQINRILRLASRRPYGGVFAVRKVVGSRFIIISGNLSFRTVQDFLSEFYHPTHDKDMSAFPLRVVIMAPFKPSFELKTLLMHYKDKVEFIQGTPVKDSDLDRVSAKVASAFYLLADQQAKDPDAEDAAQIVRTLSVHRHCGSRVRVIVELLKPEKAASAIWDDTEHGIEIICLDIIRFKLLARSCYIKGLSTFIVNLFRSGLDISKPLKGHWMEKYMHGLHQEVFPVILPDVFHKEGFTFEQAAELVYRKFNVIMFGIDIPHEYEDGEVQREVLLYPKGRTIEHEDVGLVIAKDLRTAEQISKFDHGLHSRCIGLRKFYCAACLKAGFMKTNPDPHVDNRELLDDVKQATFSEFTDHYKFEHKVSIPEFDTHIHEEPQEIQTDSTSLKGILRKGVAAPGGRHHGITSHASMLKKDKDPSTHGGQKHSLISQASLSREDIQEFNNHGQGRVLTPQASLTKILNVEDQPEKLEKSSAISSPQTIVISLEDAINMAMSWPPLQVHDKPDPAILERRTPEILDNLRSRTMNVVKLQQPHVLLCIQGKWPTSLFYFVSFLRTPGLPNPPIVILHPHSPHASDWGCIGFLDHVYFVKGSPSYEMDLLRAGVLQAEKIVILTQGIQLDQPTGEIANDQDRLTPTLTFTLDVNNVFIAATVERLLRPSKERVIVELQQETEIQYLQPRLLFDRRIFDSEMYKRNRSATFQFAPPYIDGKAFCPAALGFLMYATFFNLQTLAIVDSLICGGQVLELNPDTLEELASEQSVCELDQVGMPKCYVGETFHDLFVGMLRAHSSLAMGIYRTTDVNHAGVSFVYTNPKPTEVMEATDLVYILRVCKSP